MLYFITGNAGKFREIQAIIPDIEQLKLPVDEIQSLDPQAVIEHKLEQAATQHDGEFMIEDTSMIFKCIDPLPGTFIKWFEEGMGIERVAELVSRYDDHGAIVRVTIGYRDLSGNTHFFTEEYHGNIVPPRGTGGFGFDPIFIAEGQKRTNAELSTEEKNAFSARGIAARKLAAYLAEGAHA